MKSVAIKSVEVWFPTRIRHSSEWPTTVVEKWRERLAKVVPTAAADDTAEGVRLTLAAIAAHRDDPFQGVVEVRVIDAADDSSDLETRAAQQALARAGISATDIDLLLSHPMVPDYLCVNPGSIVHHKIGLRPEVQAFGVDGVCTSFIIQLDLARKAILSGDARYVLATQSSACTRLMPEADPFSSWFGDAGGAAVLQAAEPGFGLLATSFRTWGEHCRAFCATVPGGRWYEGGRVVAANEDRAGARKMQLEAADIARDLIAALLAKAGVLHEEVAFFAPHQPAAWFPELCRSRAGLGAAKMAQTSSFTGNLSTVNIPAQLATATREGLLKRGDVVVLFALASGMSAAGAVLRWS